MRLNIIKKIAKLFTSKKYADLVATSYKNIYDSLIEKGFTEDEAIKIICHLGSGGN